MADSSVEITAGSGTFVDTRTESTNSHHRQVIVIGDPATNAGVAPVDATTGLVVNIGPGITLGAGAVAATTPRVTHASDDPVTTAVQIMDDWDESDRAKVNIIVGQAGITAGAGAVAANTPRVTHASDDPVTTALQIIDDWDETDRAKVNPIVGQAGVAGGTGTRGATTQRVTLATDDEIVTSLSIIDDAVIADDAAFTPATTKVMMAGFEYDDTAPDSVNEGDAGAARMSANRSVYTQIRDAAGNERGAQVNYQNRMIFERGADGVTISGNVLLEMQRQPINTSTNGAILVSGIANRKIRVLNGLLMAPTAVTIQLKSNNNSDVTGPLPLGATGGFQIPQADIGDFETLTGQNLTISLSTAVQIGGWLTYVIV